MPNLWDQLATVLPTVLPRDPEKAINGTELLGLVVPRLDGHYEESSIRQHFSRMSADATSPIAKVSKGHGYYLRPTAFEPEPATPETAPEPTGDGRPASVPASSGRGGQPEEKFRAVFMRYSALENRFSMLIDHTRAEKQAAGTNKWKYPDVVLLDWDVGEVGDEGYRLDRHLLGVKRSLGEQPFRLTSVELKVEVALAGFRENFFQCVSNSKWAHSAMLVVAAPISDATLAAELRRLGTSYDVSVVSYSLEPSEIRDLPDAERIMTMSEQDFDAIASKVQLVSIATGRHRDALDWEHVRDMRSRTEDFVKLFQWISHCLDEVRPFTFDDYTKLAEIQGKYT